MISVGMYYIERKLMGTRGRKSNGVWADNYYGGDSSLDIRDNLLL